MATQDLSALFQSMQGGGQPNPLAQMMGGGQAPPELTGSPAPQINPALQAPAGTPNIDPIQAQIGALSADLNKQIEQFKTKPDDLIPAALKDFDTYNEQRYQQAYGGKGVLGTAGRALANLLSGMTHGGQTIKERLTEENRKDWGQAVKSAQEQIQQQKAQQLAEIQLQAQKLNTLKAEQQNQQFQQTLGLNQQKVDISAQSTPEAKNKTEQARIQAVIDHYKESGEPLSDTAEKYLRANGKLPPPVKESDSAFSTAKRTIEAEIKRPLTSDEILRLNEHIRFNPYDISREQLVMNSKGDFVAVPVETKKATLGPVVQNGATPKPTGIGGGPSGGRPTGVEGNITIPGQDKDFFAGVNTSLKLANPIKQKLNDPEFMSKVNTGPLAGRITLEMAEKAGGKFLSPEAIQMATDLRRLITTEAFANGGKQLTPTEKIEFERLLPQLRDTLPQAKIHLDSAIKFLETKKSERTKTLTPAQRKTLEESGAVGSRPTIKILKVE